MTNAPNRDFFRTSDTTYLGYIPNTNTGAEVAVSIDFDECSDKHLKPEKRRAVINKLFHERIATKDKNELCSGFKEVYFSDNGRNYVITPAKNLALRILAYVFQFLKIFKNESKVEYKIVESAIPHFIYHPDISLDLPEPPPLVIENCESRLKQSKAYADPFTTLATSLFQDYEPFHSWKDVKDNPYRDASEYHVIIEGDTVVAKPISDTSIDKQVIQDTITRYRDYIHEQFGASVLNRIQTDYEFNLNDMIVNASPLTPEIIYRINVGTSHVEISDIESLADTIQKGSPLPRRIAEKLKAKTDFPNNIDIKNQAHFAELAELLSVDAKEHDKIFTGRRLHGKISSWYTQGDDRLFKPWVDQQEFTQTCYKIPNRNWSCFYEDLALILCKKHLYQKNSDGTYRVGKLIPAPKKEGQPQLYYKVTNWIHNSRGIFSYTLEPACPGTSLPVIKLYRSTSASSYNLDGASSYKNDFNPINPPGYEGAHLLEPYEKEFFDKRTIPVWVGYQNVAAKKIEAMTAESIPEVFKLLSEANDAVTAKIQSAYTKPTIKQFIRTYDSEFMELIHACRDANHIGPYKAWYLLNNCLRNTVNENYSEDSEEVVYLKEFLTKACENPIFSKRATELLTWWNWQTKEPTTAEKTLIRHLEADKIACSELTEHGANLPNIRRIFSKWSNHIYDYAKSIKEDIESKKETAQNVDFVGHSLGAACAQRFLVRYTASKGRIPLPGCTIAARVYDDPAINEEDNEAFVNFGNKHADLLVALNAKYTITRRQEAGDPVPQSGETHLGAAQSDDQQKRMYKWLRFDATLQKPGSLARDPQIRDYTTAHGRLFAGANTKGAWSRSWLKRKIEETKESDPETAAKLTEELKKLPHTDYKITHFDARTQWNFDHPSSGKMWEDLSRLWKLPFRFTPIYAEQLRTYLSAAFRSGFFHIFLPNTIAQLGLQNPPDDKAHGDWQKHCDDKGVFIAPKPPQN